MGYKGNALKTAKSVSYLTTVSDKTVTVAELYVNVNGTDYYVTGNSKLMPGDKYDAKTGEYLAVYRAVRQLENMLKQVVDNLET